MDGYAITLMRTVLFEHQTSQYGYNTDGAFPLSLAPAKQRRASFLILDD